MGGVSLLGSVSDGCLAFGMALATAPIVLWVLRRKQLLDIPTARSSHQQATPRSGGVAPALGCVLAGSMSGELSGATRGAILVVSVCLGIIGLADDLRRRPALLRLVGQGAVALVALVWLARGLSGGILLRSAVVGGIVLWLVGYVNAFNFMDGINGLAVAQVVVAGVSWWLIGWHEHVPTLAAAGLISAAAVAAFAPFNVPSAKMFLGDVGSYFLGGWLAVAVVVGLRADVSPEAVVAPMTLFVADAGVTLVRRVKRRQPWSQPHKDHAYQRLVQAGWSHLRTTLTIGILLATISALGALSLTGSPALRAFGDVVASVVVAAYLILPSIASGHSVTGGATNT
jgi:UDP-GlcNAc:undecaprenyl-phosphate/decaprenyl-phosphate GlcNAc-1-phosphate transferase